jgi:RimJ/RimL family protein N-acetyltransferase
MKPMRTERLILRNWQERDRPLFHRINSDERVMEFFPFRRDRAAADAKMDELNAAIDRNGFGFAAAEIAATGQCIGFIGITRTDDLPFVPAGTIEIGWRLGQGLCWRGGGGLARLRLRDAWPRRDRVPRRPRQSSLHRGHEAARHDHRPSRGFRPTGHSGQHPSLKRHVFYRLARKTWQASKRAAR